MKFASMHDELEKIAARGFKKRPGERVSVRPGLIEIQKVGGPLSLLKRIGRGFKRMGRRKPKGAPGRALQVIPASPVVKGRTSSPRASKGKGLVLPAAMIGTGLAIGGTALGASKIIEKSMEPHRRVQPPYSGGY